MKSTFRRHSWFGVVAVAVALVASACLGPGQFDPTGRAPIGSLDVIRDAGGSIHVAGWALDPETSAPVVVKVGAEGVVHDVMANGNRSDVAALYPGYGAAHGFDHTFGYLAPGLHGICVWVTNQVGAGDDRLLGCKNLQVSAPDPVGSLDVVTSPAPRSIAVQGWAFDPNNAGSAEVVITLDNQFARRMTADGYRPDVGAAFGRSPATGFAANLDVTPGTHQVCVDALNVDWGQDTRIGCKMVGVAEAPDRRPTGQLTSVTPQGGGSVAVTGIAADPDGTAGLQVRLDVTGASSASVTVPVVGGVFSTTLTGLNDGTNTICPVGLDVAGAPGITGPRGFSCGTAILGATSVGTAGIASGAAPVGPPPGHPLQRTERDAGVSTTLSNGSVMWFFGDTAEFDGAHNLKYFVNNTAAWAYAGSPNLTRDAVAGGRPVPFVSPPTNWCAGVAGFPNAAMWPESAVTIPQGGGIDRVVVFMSKVCLGDSFLEIKAMGMSVVETTYNGAALDGAAITGTVTVPDFAGVTRAWGAGANFDGTHVYAYQCSRPDGGGGLPDSYGPCRVARATPATLTNVGSWTYWNGGNWTAAGSWVSDQGQAASMTLPAAPGPVSTIVPVASFTVTRDPVHNVYVMLYTPYPGVSTMVFARTAATPVGPWTAPMRIDLPGCGGDGNWCYAGTAQPKFSSSGRLGIGYMDMSYNADATRSQYMVATVPFKVVP